MPIDEQNQMRTDRSTAGKAGVEISILGRIWLGLLILLTLTSGREPRQPVFFADAAVPASPGEPTLADLLDKIATVVGRAWRWMEAKLGLRPKEWPQI